MASLPQSLPISDDLTAFPGAVELLDAWNDGLRDESLQTVSEWADRHRFLSTRASAEPGRWHTSRTPYLKEPMDRLSPLDPAEVVVFMKAAQVGGTEAGNNWLGYIIDQAPGPIMLVMPTEQTATRASKQRIGPLISESPRLRGKVRNAARRDSGNTILTKEFDGGILIMTGANSDAGLRSMPVRYLFLDEVDGYPADAAGGGDPVDLAEKRTITFARRKVFMVSTPLLASSSRISAAYEESDRRRYFVPCPDCGHMQVLVWAQVRWPSGRPEEAAYMCGDCGTLAPEHRKPEMLDAGEWRPEAEGDGKTVGYHLSALYSPWFKWADAAAEFLKAKASPERLQTWTNTTLGEVWVEPGETLAWEGLYDRREGYRIGTVPAGGLFLTAGVDVQGDRIEVEIVAWGPEAESWSIDYRVFPGNPFDGHVLLELDRMLDEYFSHELGGEIKIGRLAIDAGFASQAIYKWVETKSPAAVMAIKGSTRQSAPVGQPSVIMINQGGRKVKSGSRLWPINVDMFKHELYGRLKLRPPREEGDPTPPGIQHFPEHGPEYFKMLTAEQLVERKDRRGFPVHEWQKLRARNEALDCRIYATAAAHRAGVPRWPESRWERERAALDIKAAAAAAPKASLKDLL